MHTRIMINDKIQEKIFKTLTKNQNRISQRARLLHRELCRIGIKHRRKTKKSQDDFGGLNRSPYIEGNDQDCGGRQ